MHQVSINEKEGVNLDLVTDWSFGPVVKREVKFQMSRKEAEEQGMMEDRLILNFAVAFGDEGIHEVEFFEEEARVLHAYILTQCEYRLTTRK